MIAVRASVEKSKNGLALRNAEIKASSLALRRMALVITLDLFVIWHF